MSGRLRLDRSQPGQGAGLPGRKKDVIAYVATRMESLCGSRDDAKCVCEEVYVLVKAREIYVQESGERDGRGAIQRARCESRLVDEGRGLPRTEIERAVGGVEARDALHRLRREPAALLGEQTPDMAQSELLQL